MILKHPDFNNGESSASAANDPTPRFTYKKRSTTRYVLILDATQDTMVRESWAFLRVAIRNWVLHNLPSNTEVGVIIANDTGTFLQYDISTFSEAKNRNLIASFIPYSPSESQKAACMSCAVRDAQKMLEKQTIDYGAASSVILVIAPGMDTRTDHETLAKAARDEHVRIVTINYPGVIHRKPLDALSQLTSGKSFTLFESKQNSERTFLTTYFDLVNILYDIMAEYYEGNRLELPMEIHRKKLYDINDDQSAKRRSISGTFLLDETMGSPSSFLIYTHNIEYPLISSLALTSPSRVTYLKRSDERLQMKQLSIEAQINETGSWTYTIDRINGNPQPHFVQVMATVRRGATSAIIVKAWIEHKLNRLGNGPIIVYVEVKKGDLPVSDALVEMTVTRPESLCDTPTKCEQVLRIFDTGSGDPDITKGDGIYTRYFNPSQMGAGAYQFDIHVSDNGNTAYSVPSNYRSDADEPHCCGSFVPHPTKKPLPTFQRIVPSITVFVSEQQAQNEMSDTLGSIGDMRVESVDESKIRLVWTAPDMGGLNVARYDVKYAFHVQDIVDSFDTALSWEHDSPMPFSVGDQTAFTMNISIDPSLVGTTFHIAVRPYARLAIDARPGPVSNYVRVHVKAPPPPPAIPASNEGNSPFDGYGNDSVLGSPYNAAEMEWIVIAIIATVASIIILCFVAFCYFCLAKRRNRANEKSAKGSICESERFTKQSKSDKAGVDVSNNFIPSLTNGGDIHQIPAPVPMNQDYIYQKTPYEQSTYIICPSEVADPHIVGLPIYKSDDGSDTHQQQYSMDHELENDSIDKYKDDQAIYRAFGHPQQSTLNRNGRILSPYESWSASQLLHEHERRHSSLDDMINPVDCVDHDIHRNNDDISLIQSKYHKGDRLSLAGPQMSNEMIMNSAPMNLPPVPPLPYTTNNSGYPFNYQIYSGIGVGSTNTRAPSTGNYSMIFRNNEPQQQHAHQMRSQNSNNNNTSLQGSLCSLHSGSDLKKKTRTITMV